MSVSPTFPVVLPLLSIKFPETSTVLLPLRVVEFGGFLGIGLICYILCRRLVGLLSLGWGLYLYSLFVC